ncbi:cardiolipin synthase [Fructilactobacillus cliffordii]|uniref:Cardiolipin synthase n=1 Tax=Fructilactobacillus cliffordii TaxID=2940299 RepID=A0A9Q8ZSM8_9LACO|nr:cardiolipin synthase [Fructilactobacillus cliffordii]USS89053.1 cardiolipin synthase [Fructilactobacillus cliffordii]
MSLILEIIGIIILLNTIAAIVTVFRQPRNIAATWAWFLVLVFVPVIGFFIYAFFGRRLPKNRMLLLSGSTKKQVSALIRRQKRQLGKVTPEENTNYKILNRAQGMIEMFMNTATAPLLGNNKVDVYTNGNDFIKQLFADIENAKSSIHIEFYTFYADKIGTQTLNLLTQKAQEGVEVRVIYDAWGSMGTNEKFFRPLIEAGGKAYPFLHNRFNLIDMRVNFRDHHKVVTIDGEYGYIGGMNIGDQYMGWKKKFGNWYDCMMRVHGLGVQGLQSRFILDWNATASNDKIDPNEKEAIKKYYPDTHTDGNAAMQIVASDPISSMEQIKMGYIKLIGMAHHSIKIMTPYLIPDESVLDALKIAVKSGVRVEIMTPSMPDHAFVYRATQYYTEQLTKLGIKVYAYNNGFLHAKTMVIDDELVSIGSANLDYRSFELNFECNAFVYDKDLANRMEAIYEAAIAESTLQTHQIFVNESWWLNFKQHFSRLLSPLL